MLFIFYSSQLFSTLDVHQEKRFLLKKEVFLSESFKKSLKKKKVIRYAIRKAM